MNTRQEKKLRTICSSFVAVGAFVPDYAEKKLLRAGKPVVSEAYTARYDNLKKIGTWIPTISENAIIRFSGAY